MMSARPLVLNGFSPDDIADIWEQIQQEKKRQMKLVDGEFILRNDIFLLPSRNQEKKS